MSRFLRPDLLNALTAALKVSDKDGMPNVLETGFVQPVVEILGRQPSWKKPSMVVENNTIVTSGALIEHRQGVLSPEGSLGGVMRRGFVYRLLASETIITFPIATVVDLSRIELRYVATCSGDPGPTIVLTGGDLGTTPLLLDSDTLVYRFGLGVPTSGADGTGAVVGGTISRPPWPKYLWRNDVDDIQFAGDFGENFWMDQTLRYGSVIGVPTVWPAGVTIATTTVAQEIPESEVGLYVDL